jgi:CRISPR-associated protein Cas5d
MKPNIIEFKVYGGHALFSDPVTRVGGEKFSYQVPTYEALKGVTHSIYWKPTFIWVIDKVRIMRPIQTETKSIRIMKYNDSDSCDRSFYTYLKNVEYQVQAHFVWNENRKEFKRDRNENKHHSMAKRFLERGGRRDIFLGTRECQAYVEPCVFGECSGAYDNISELSFGNMFHGITYPDEATSAEDKDKLMLRFWECKMKKGVIEFPLPGDIPEERKRRLIRKAPIKKFEYNKNFTGLKEFENLI